MWISVFHCVNVYSSGSSTIYFLLKLLFYTDDLVGKCKRIIGWKEMILVCCIGNFAVKMFNVDLHQLGKHYPLFVYQWNFLLNLFIKNIGYLRNDAIRWEHPGAVSIKLEKTRSLGVDFCLLSLSMWKKPNQPPPKKIDEEY